MWWERSGKAGRDDQGRQRRAEEGDRAWERQKGTCESDRMPRDGQLDILEAEDDSVGSQDKRLKGVMQKTRRLWDLVVWRF